MSKWHDIRNISLLFIITAFIMVFAYYGPQLVQKVSGGSSTYSTGTQVGPIDLSNLTKEEARDQLTSAAFAWLNTHQLRVVQADNVFKFEKELIHIDIPETITTIRDGQSTVFSVTVDKELLKAKLAAISDNVKLDQLISDITSKAENLDKAPMEMNLYSYLKSDVTPIQDTVSSYQISNLPNINLEQAIKLLDGTTISPRRPFSFLEVLGNGNANEESLHIVATAIYGAILNTNFVIQQRHISQRLPEYAEIGKEAVVNKQEGLDLVFINPNKQDYQLKINQSGKKLTVTIVGDPLGTNVEVHVIKKEEIPSRTVIHYSTELRYGQKTVLKQGKAGVVVEVYRQQKKLFGKKQILVSTDYYPPISQIELHSTSENG